MSDRDEGMKLTLNRERVHKKNRIRSHPLFFGCLDRKMEELGGNTRSKFVVRVRDSNESGNLNNSVNFILSTAVISHLWGYVHL